MIEASTIGVVVIGRNEAAHLAACLESVAPYLSRTVYADSASTDQSTQIATEAGVSVVDLEGTIPLTPARGRNEGFQRLQQLHRDCQFVQFVDGDSAVAPGWIEAASAFLRDHHH